MDPLIISCALTGALATPKENASLPFDPEAIGRDALEAARAGAAIVHIHAREDDGTPAWETKYFERTLDVIRAENKDVLVNLTTGFGGTEDIDWEIRFAPLPLHPELASFDAGSMNFGPWMFRNSPDFLAALAKRMLDEGVKPELEIFDTGQIGNVMRLVGEGVIPEPLWFQFVLGVAGGAPATLRNLAHLVGELPPGASWSVAGVGRYQLPMNVYAIAMGGHARTGLEDNLWIRKGESATNGTLVSRVRSLAEQMERPVATPAQAREILGLG